MKIEFQQAVYGRVDRGLFSEGAGYQWAAASHAVRDQPALLDELLHAGRCPEPPSGQASPSRLGFFRAKPDWLVFTRVGRGIDGSGRGSYFAHHLMSRSADFLDIGLTPAAVLRHLSFFRREGDLPDERNLPALVLELPDFALPEGPLEMGSNADYATLQFLLHPEGFATATWITSDDSEELLLDRVDRIQSMLPPEVAAEQTFCLNFCYSLDGITAFRLVTVPGTEFLARRREEYRIIKDSLAADAVRFLAELRAGHVEEGAWRQMIALLSGYGPWSQQDRDSMLDDPSTIPLVALAESEWPDWNLDWLATDPFLYARYHALLPEWKLDGAREYFRERPLEWAQGLAPHFARYPDVRVAVFRWISEYLAEWPEDSYELVQWVQQMNFLDGIAISGVEAGPSNAMAAAENAGRILESYDGSLHREIGLHLVHHLTMTPEERAEDAWTSSVSSAQAWLLDPEQSRHAPSETSLVFHSTSLLRGRTPDDLPPPELMSDSLFHHFSGLLATAARQGARRRMEDWERLLTNEPRHRSGVEHLLEELLRNDEGGAAFAAAARLGVLEGLSVERMIRAIERFRCRAAAKAWLMAEKDGFVALNESQRRRLEDISKFWRGFFGN
jgi:hypothetical protein